jgi:hypothetical protein
MRPTYGELPAAVLLVKCDSSLVSEQLEMHYTMSVGLSPTLRLTSMAINCQHAGFQHPFTQVEL